MAASQSPPKRPPNTPPVLPTHALRLEEEAAGPAQLTTGAVPTLTVAMTSACSAAAWQVLGTGAPASQATAYVHTVTRRRETVPLTEHSGPTSQTSCRFGSLQPFPLFLCE